MKKNWRNITNHAGGRFRLRATGAVRRQALNLVARLNHTYGSHFTHRISWLSSLGYLKLIPINPNYYEFFLIYNLIEDCEMIFIYCFGRQVLSISAIFFQNQGTQQFFSKSS